MVDCGTVVLCSQERSYWFAIEALFALFFFVEAILRIHQLGYDYFLDAWLTPQKKSRFFSSGSQQGGAATICIHLWSWELWLWNYTLVPTCSSQKSRFN